MRTLIEVVVGLADRVPDNNNDNDNDNDNDNTTTTTRSSYDHARSL